MYIMYAAIYNGWSSFVIQQNAFLPFPKKFSFCYFAVSLEFASLLCGEEKTGENLIFPFLFSFFYFIYAFLAVFPHCCSGRPFSMQEAIFTNIDWRCSWCRGCWRRVCWIQVWITSILRRNLKIFYMFS